MAHLWVVVGDLLVKVTLDRYVLLLDLLHEINIQGWRREIQGDKVTLHLQKVTSGTWETLTLKDSKSNLLARRNGSIDRSFAIAQKEHEDNVKNRAVASKGALNRSLDADKERREAIHARKNAVKSIAEDELYKWIQDTQNTEADDEDNELVNPASSVPQKTIPRQVAKVMEEKEKAPWKGPILEEIDVEDEEEESQKQQESNKQLHPAPLRRNAPVKTSFTKRAAPTPARDASEEIEADANDDDDDDDNADDMGDSLLTDQLRKDGSEQAESEVTLYGRAKNFFDSEDYLSAEAACDAGLAIRPAHLPLRLLRSTIRLKRGQAAGALLDTQVVIRRLSGGPSAKGGGAGGKNAAVTPATKLQLLAAAHVKRAAAQDALGLVDDAEGSLRQAARTLPANEGCKADWQKYRACMASCAAYNKAGKQQAAANQWEAALQSFAAGLALSASHRSLLANASAAALRCGRAEVAASYCSLILGQLKVVEEQTGLVLTPEERMLQRNVRLRAAAACVAVGDAQAAQAQYNRAREENPEDAQVLADVEAFEANVKPRMLGV